MRFFLLQEGSAYPASRDRKKLPNPEEDHKRSATSQLVCDLYLT